MEIEQDLVAIGLGHVVRSDDTDRNAGDFVFDEMVGAELAPCRGGSERPCVGAAAALGQRLGRGLVGLGAGKRVFCLVAEAGRNGNDPRDVRRALGVDVAGVAGGRIGGGGGLGSRLCGQCGGGQKGQKSGGARA